jgi:hypothetical protein
MMPALFIVYVPQTAEDTEDGGGSDAEERKKKKHVKNAITTHEQGGWPLIPKKQDKMNLEMMKSVIRAYVTATYRECFFVYKVLWCISEMASQGLLQTTKGRRCHGKCSHKT